MSLLAEVLGELWSMFAGDARLSLAVLAVVAVAALLALGAGWPLLAGLALLAGSLGVLAASVLSQARKARNSTGGS